MDRVLLRFQFGAGIIPSQFKVLLKGGIGKMPTMVSGGKLLLFQTEGDSLEGGNNWETHTYAHTQCTHAHLRVCKNYFFQKGNGCLLYVDYLSLSSEFKSRRLVRFAECEMITQETGFSDSVFISLPVHIYALDMFVFLVSW